MCLSMSSFGGQRSNDAAAPHCDGDSHAFDHAADHSTEPLVVNTLRDDPAGTMSSKNSSGSSTVVDTCGDGTGATGRAACANTDDDSAPGVPPSDSGGGASDTGAGGGDGASNGPPIKAHLNLDGRQDRAGDGAIDEAAPVALPRMEMHDDKGDGSLPMPPPSTTGEDWVGSDNNGGGPQTNAPPTRGLAGHCVGCGGCGGDAERDLDSILPPPAIPEIPECVLREGREEDDGLGYLPRSAGRGDSVGTETVDCEEGNKWSYNEAAASDVSLVSTDQAGGNAAGDGHDLVTKPPAGGNEDGSPACGRGPVDGERAEGEAGKSRIGGLEDLTAIDDDDDDVARPPSSSTADEDVPMCAPFARKLPDGDDSAGGVPSWGGGGGSVGGGTGGGGAGTNGYASGSYGWVLTTLHVALLQGVALRAA